MTTNGQTGSIVSAPSTHLAELAAWNDAIAALDTAVADAAAARAAIARLAEEIDLTESRATLAATGNNAEARKVAVTLALAEDAGYQTFLARSREGRQRLAEAERRVIVLKERCRLFRSAMASPMD